MSRLAMKGGKSHVIDRVLATREISLERERAYSKVPAV